jgi:hypothetical protein
MSSVRKLWQSVAVILLLSVAAAAAPTAAPTEQWTPEKAKTWYKAQPWLVGANYGPASAINELEMWQADTFDPKRIDLELGWAEKIGLNTMRVFLHDLLWKQDPEGFKKRIDTFLTISAKHKIRPMLVLFDSVWDPNPQLGKQRAPRPGVHNSGWMQSPGAKALADPAEHPRLEAYVKGVVGAFANDDRILAWDIWNEPDNENRGSYDATELKNKVELVAVLLPKAFQWAREAGATQPLTSGVWKGDWTSVEKMTPVERMQVDLSDVVTFHSYDNPTEFEKRIHSLERYNRPIICTEYMARGNGSTFLTTIPVALRFDVGVYNWGFVAGKTQTNLPWDSWQRPYTDREPSIWFHEILRNDGSPYIPEEVTYLKRVIAERNRKAKAAGAR